MEGKTEKKKKLGIVRSGKVKVRLSSHLKINYFHLNIKSFPTLPTKYSLTSTEGN